MSVALVNNSAAPVDVAVATRPPETVAPGATFDLRTVAEGTIGPPPWALDVTGPTGSIYHGTLTVGDAPILRVSDEGVAVSGHDTFEPPGESDEMTDEGTPGIGENPLTAKAPVGPVKIPKTPIGLSSNAVTFVSSAVRVSSASWAELSAVAAPAGSGCGSSRLIVPEWYTNYTGAAEGTDALAPSPNNWGVGPTLATFTAGGGKLYTEESEIWGDPEIVRLPDGRLMMTRATFLGYPFYRIGADGTLFHSWAAYQSALDHKDDPATPADTRALYTWQVAHRLRSVQQTWVSADCGQKWTLGPSVDAASADGGFCGDPRVEGKVKVASLTQEGQPIVDGNGKPVVTEAEQYWPGGWDRSEMAADPWTGRVFESMSCIHGHPSQAAMTMWRLDPAATQFVRVADFPAWVPAPITVTRSGAVWVFTCSGDAGPTVYRSAGSGDSWEKVAIGGGPCRSAGERDDTDPGRYTGELAGDIYVTLADVSIARAGDDAVRVTYPVATKVRDYKGGEDTVQSTYVEAAAAYTNGALTQKVAGQLVPVDASASIIGATFVDYDHTLPYEAKPDGSYPGALYWIESDPVHDVERVRVAAVRSGDNWGKAIQLDQWTRTVAPGGEHGHYVNGTSYCAADGQVHVLPVWGHLANTTTTKDGVSTPADYWQIATGDVTIGRACDPKATASTEPLPTLLVPKTLPTLKPTIPPPTTLPTQTTPATVPAPLAIMSITVVPVPPCVVGTTTTDCPVKVTFELAGSQAGSITWRLEGTDVWSCDQTTPFSLNQGAVAVAAGQKSVTVDATIALAHNPNANYQSVGYAASVVRAVATAPSGSSATAMFFGTSCKP